MKIGIHENLSWYQNIEVNCDVSKNSQNVITMYEIYLYLYQC